MQNNLILKHCIAHKNKYLGVNGAKRRASGLVGLQIFAARNGLAGIQLAKRITHILVVLHQALEIAHTSHGRVLRAENLRTRGGSVAVGVVDFALGGDAAHVRDLLEVRIVVACPVGLALMDKRDGKRDKAKNKTNGTRRNVEKSLYIRPTGFSSFNKRPIFDNKLIAKSNLTIHLPPIFR